MHVPQCDLSSFVFNISCPIFTDHPAWSCKQMPSIDHNLYLWSCQIQQERSYWYWERKLFITGNIQDKMRSRFTTKVNWLFNFSASSNDCIFVSMSGNEYLQWELFIVNRLICVIDDLSGASCPRLLVREQWHLERK